MFCRLIINNTESATPCDGLSRYFLCADLPNTAPRDCVIYNNSLVFSIWPLTPHLASLRASLSSRDLNNLRRVSVSLPVRRGPPEDDLVQTPLELLALELQALYCGGEAPDLLPVQDRVLGQPLVVPLYVQHGDLQLFVDFHPTFIHLPESGGLF